VKTLSWFFTGLGLWVTGLAIYGAFALFIARVLSYKWHPDGGEHDPETCAECDDYRYGEEPNEWIR
jgi:hypothetical protein